MRKILLFFVLCSGCTRLDHHYEYNIGDVVETNLGQKGMVRSRGVSNGNIFWVEFANGHGDWYKHQEIRSIR